MNRCLSLSCTDVWVREAEVRVLTQVIEYATHAFEFVMHMCCSSWCICSILGRKAGVSVRRDASVRMHDEQVFDTTKQLSKSTTRRRCSRQQRRCSHPARQVLFEPQAKNLPREWIWRRLRHITRKRPLKRTIYNWNIFFVGLLLIIASRVFIFILTSLLLFLSLEEIYVLYVALYLCWYNFAYLCVCVCVCGTVTVIIYYLSIITYLCIEWKRFTLMAPMI